MSRARSKKTRNPRRIMPQVSHVHEELNCGPDLSLSDSPITVNEHSFVAFNTPVPAPQSSLEGPPIEAQPVVEAHPDTRKVDI